MTKTTAATERDIYTDYRPVPAIEYDRLTSPAGLPSVYIVPSDREDERTMDLCEVGLGDADVRVTRAELLEWAQAIVRTVQTS